mgnify:CR=1 FL=1
MVQNQEQPVGKITFSILIALSLSHCLNDLLQSVLSASYPLFKDDLGLSFAQIGFITLVYQLSASVFQPITGIIFDKYPVAWSLPIGMSFTMVGLVNLAFFQQSLLDTIICVLNRNRLFGTSSGSFPYHLPASGGKRGLAQSLFQVAVISELIRAVIGSLCWLHLMDDNIFSYLHLWPFAAIVVMYRSAMV